MTAVDIARMSRNEHCVTTIERCRKELEQDPELKKIVMKNDRRRPPETRDSATQTEDWPPATKTTTTTMVEQSVQYSSDDGEDVTETSEVISPMPGVDASTMTTEEVPARKKTASSKRRQHRSMSRGELIQAQVKAYEAVRAASGGLQAARLEQMRSTYGVRAKSRSDCQGIGSASSRCGSAFPPRTVAISREHTVAGFLERTYNRAVPITPDRYATSADFHIRPGTCRLLGEFTVNVQGRPAASPFYSSIFF
jgi:hypothetical protein